jgi:hypothetical protein
LCVFSAAISELAFTELAEREQIRQCRFGLAVMIETHDASGVLRADALTETGRFSSATRCCACVD